MSALQYYIEFFRKERACHLSNWCFAVANRLQLDTMFSDKGQIVEELQCEPAALFKPELLCETVKEKADEQLIAEEVANAAKAR